jgi:hypothetical protein
MTNRLIYTPPTPERKPGFGAAEANAGQVGQPGLAHAGEGHSSPALLFLQLAQSLTVLSGAAELVLDGKAGDDSLQALRVWLHPNARQAELAMHQLRDQRLTKSPALNDLCQSLTVLVLAADMLTQGQLSGADSLTFYGLLRRNADSAIKNLAELRGQLLSETQQRSAK